MKRILAVLIILVAATPAVAMDSVDIWRIPQQSQHQIAPSTAFADTGLVTMAVDDTLTFYFGFLSQWVTIEAYDDSVTALFLCDTALPLTLNPTYRTQTLSDADTLQFASSRGAAGINPRIDGDVFTCPVNTARPYYSATFWVRVGGVQLVNPAGGAATAAAVQIFAGGVPRSGTP